MADKLSDPSMEPLFFSVDPMSLLISQNSDSHELGLLLDGFSGFERGPRYVEYARLRDAKLRVKRDFENILAEEEERFFGGGEPRKTTQHVNFEGDLVISSEDEDRVSLEMEDPARFGFKMAMTRRKPSMLLAQSVPDFSPVTRKENRRPTANPYAIPRRVDLTPPPLKSRSDDVLGSASERGSKSASAGERKGRVMGMAARKSYASVEDLKKISMAAASAINGEGGRRKTFLSYRQFY